MKNTPGSPVRHAPTSILSQTSLARSWPVTFLLHMGSTKSYALSASSAFMNVSVTPTEMLKFTICVRVFLARDELQDIRMSVDAQDPHVQRRDACHPV